MKKSLSIILAALVVLSALGIGIATAEEDSQLSIEIGSTLTVIGTGTMDRTLVVQSEWGYAGQRLSEDMYTRHMGTAGASEVDYSSALEVFIGTSDTTKDVNTTDISYASSVLTSMMKRDVCSQNYEAGMVSSVKSVGASKSVLDIDMTPDANYLTYEGAIDGKIRLSHMVVDPESRLKVSKEVTDLKGLFELEFEAFGEKMIDVGDEGDWLGCP